MAVNGMGIYETKTDGDAKLSNEIVKLQNLLKMDFNTLGRGFSRLPEESEKCLRLQSAIVGQPVITEPQIGWEMSATLISDEQELKSQLELSTKFMTSAFMSATLNAGYKKKQSQNSMFLLADFTHIKKGVEFSQHQSIAVKPDAQKIYEMSPNDFHDTYGESFVSRIGVGNKVIIVIKINFKCDKELQTLKSQLKEKKTDLGATLGYESGLDSTQISCEVCAKATTLTQGIQKLVEEIPYLCNLQELRRCLDNIKKQLPYISKDQGESVMSFETHDYTAVGGLHNFRNAILSNVKYVEKYLKIIDRVQERAELLFTFPDKEKFRNFFNIIQEIQRKLQQWKLDLKGSAISEVQRVIDGRKEFLDKSIKQLNNILGQLRDISWGSPTLSEFRDFVRDPLPVNQGAQTLARGLWTMLPWPIRGEQTPSLVLMKDVRQEYHWSYELEYKPVLHQFKKLKVETQMDPDNRSQPKVRFCLTQGSGLRKSYDDPSEIDISQHQDDLENSMKLMTTLNARAVRAVVKAQFFEDEVVEIREPISPRR